MLISESRLHDVLVLNPAGRLDSANAPALAACLSGSLARGETSLVLDLSALDYVSSAGLSVLLAAAKKAQRANGRIALAGLNRRVHEVMELSGFTSIFSIFPSVEAAIANTA